MVDENKKALIGAGLIAIHIAVTIGVVNAGLNMIADCLSCYL